MQREARTIETVDDDPNPFDVPPEWLVSDFVAVEHADEHDGDGWLRSLANDVTLLSSRAWPKPRTTRADKDRWLRTTPSRFRESA